MNHWTTFFFFRIIFYRIIFNQGSFSFHKSCPDCRIKYQKPHFFFVLQLPQKKFWTVPSAAVCQGKQGFSYSFQTAKRTSTYITKYVSEFKSVEVEANSFYLIRFMPCRYFCHYLSYLLEARTGLSWTKIMYLFGIIIFWKRNLDYLFH